MGKITLISAQKNNKKRANIFIDNEYRCSLDKMAVISFGLKQGMEIDEQKLNELTFDSELKSAFDSAVSYISTRMRCVSEITKYLMGKKFSGDAIEQTVKKLKEYGYLNDAEFARAYVKGMGKKYGNKKLSYDLARLNIDEEIIESCLAEEGCEQESIERVAQKYLKTHTKNVNVNKLATFLYSKGFSGGLSKKTAQKYICESENDSGTDCDND